MKSSQKGPFQHQNVRQFFAFSAMLSVLVLLLACNKPNAPDCFQRAGDDGSEWRWLVGNPTEILMDDRIDVRLVPSEENKVLVEGPENLINEIETSLDGEGVLTIEDLNTCNLVRKPNPGYSVTVYAKPQAIRSIGSGDLTFSDTLHVDHFSLNCENSTGQMNCLLNADSVFVSVVEGVSDVILRGSCRQLDAFHQGINLFDASGLYSTSVALNSNSINDMHVRAEEYFFVAIDNQGFVYYQGEPDEISLYITGTGQLINNN